MHNGKKFLRTVGDAELPENRLMRYITKPQFCDVRERAQNCGFSGIFRMIRVVIKQKVRYNKQVVFFSKNGSHNRADKSYLSNRKEIPMQIMLKQGRARRGQFATPHGTIQTPAFMNVATCAAIKGAVSAYDLKELKCQGAAVQYLSSARSSGR